MALGVWRPSADEACCCCSQADDEVSRDGYDKAHAHMSTEIGVLADLAGQLGVLPLMGTVQGLQGPEEPPVAYVFPTCAGGTLAGFISVASR